jgi:hypothetical protein
MGDFPMVVDSSTIKHSFQEAKELLLKELGEASLEDLKKGQGRFGMYSYWDSQTKDVAWVIHVWRGC